MSEEPQPIEAEVVAVEPKPPRFDLRNAKPETYNEKVTEIMSRTGLERWQVEGILADCVMQSKSKELQSDIARRWGVEYGKVTSCRNMGKLTIDECRSALGTKSIMLANAAMDQLMNHVASGELKAKELISIGKQYTDNALNLENKAVGATSTTNINVGDVAILIQNKEERAKQGGGDAFARLLAKGINPDLVEKAKG